MDNALTGFVKTIIFNGLEAFGRYYSSYRGIVFDNGDPYSLQRLKLIIPQIGGSQAYNYWAFPKGVFYGNGYGSQVIPQKGDVVWVEFEGGHPERPIWVHGHPAIKEVPTDPELLDVDCYWFKTPKGNLIKLYDTKNKVHIENITGEVYEQNDYGHSIATDKKISLGTLNGSKEPAVLGDTIMDLLNEFITDLGNIGLIQTSSGITDKINTSPLWEILVEKWNEKWEDFKSQKVNLD